MPESEKRKGIGKMPVKERLVSISAGYERERAHQIVQGISELLDVPLREAIKRADSVRIFERLDVDPESFLSNLESTRRCRFKRGDRFSGGRLIKRPTHITGTIYRGPTPPAAL